MQFHPGSKVKDLAGAMLASALIAGASGAGAASFERTEQREPCAEYTEMRRPMFGDLHVHTSYSFDSYVSSQRNDPDAAYRYAKGEPIMLSDADAEQTVRAQIQRPLDFTGVTDHSEFLGPINLCTTDSSRLAYWFPACIATRSENFYVQLLAADYWVSLGVVDTASEKQESFVCRLGDCVEAHKAAWRGIQEAAERHYDRSSDCTFTSFIGYEYTDAPDFANLHRNVIFRNDKVTETQINKWTEDCLEAISGSEKECERAMDKCNESCEHLDTVEDVFNECMEDCLCPNGECVCDAP